MPTPTEVLFATLTSYKDPYRRYLHRDLKKPYETQSAQQLLDLKTALEAGAKWRAPLASGDDAAFTAAFFDDPRPLALLLDAGVPLDHASARRTGTLMHHAASFGRKRVVQLLAERGASVLAKDKFGKLPLDAARAWKHGEDALPLLTRLTKRALKTTAPTAEGELAKKVVFAALPSLSKHFSKHARRDLSKFVNLPRQTSATRLNF